MKAQACSTVERLASEARGWEEATMPLLPSTGDLRLLKSMMWNGSLGLREAMAARNSIFQHIERLSGTYGAVQYCISELTGKPTHF